MKQNVMKSSIQVWFEKQLARQPQARYRSEAMATTDAATIMQ
jgi:hypothetical protein